MTAPNPSYKPSEGKREEFRKYLEKNGVMDALTRVLVNLYEEVEKPEDALEYIRDKLAMIAGLETHKQLQLKLADAEDKIKELESQIQTDTTLRAGSMAQPTEGAPEDHHTLEDEQVPPKEDPSPEDILDE